MSSDDQSGIDQSTPPLSSILDKEKHIERIINNRGIQTFLVVDHTANLRKNSKVSAIWHHGGERRRLDDDSMIRYWRCAHYTGSAIILKVDGNKGQTIYALLHLKNKHNIDCNVDDEVVPSSITAFSATVSAGALTIVTVASKAVREAYRLIIIYDAAKFRQTLIIFIIIYNIAFSVVKSLYFQALLNCYSTALTPFFIKAHSTVKRWILKEFKKKRL
jgi:hypothetical protein